jgi:hypothetical protein
MRISLKFKSFLSKWYLEYAERHSNSKFLSISDLTSIRKRQIKESNNVSQSSALPADVKLNLTNLLLFKSFHVEDVVKLERALGQIFGKKAGQRSINRFFESKGKLTGASLSLIGRLYPKSTKKKKGFFQSIAYIKNMPSFVKLIEVGFYRIIPSYYILTFNAILKESVSDDLLNHIQRKYFSEINFNNVIPWKLRTSGYNSNPVINVMVEKFSEWQKDLKRDVEHCISKFFKTSYISGSNTGFDTTAIELYTIENDKYFNSNVKEWYDHHDYLRYYNIPFNYPLTFKNDMYVIIFPEYEKKIRNNFKIIASRNDIEKDSKNYNEGKLFNFTDYINPLIQDITFIFAPFNTFKSLQNDVEDIRYKLLTEITKGKKLKITNLLNLMSSIERISQLNKRIDFEISDNKKWFLEITEDVQDVSMFHLSIKSGKSLQEFLSKEIEAHHKFLEKNIKLVQDSFKEFLNYTNINIAYKLQKKMFWLTIIIMIATLLGVWVNWDKIYKDINLIIDKISLLLF